jgi:hypothetical protein
MAGINRRAWKMVKAVAFMVTLIPWVIVFSQISEPEQLPPREVLQLVLDRESYGEVRCLRTLKPWNGISYDEVVEPKWTDVDAWTLLNLIYGRNEIPGMPVTPNYNSGIHTNITIHNKVSRIVRDYFSEEQVKEIISWPLRHHAHWLRIWLEVHSTKEKAMEEGRRYFAYLYKNFNATLPSGLSSIGEAHWNSGSQFLPRRFDLGFVEGRVMVWLLWGSQTQANPVLVEALGWGIEYRIQQNSKLLGMAQRPITLLVANKPIGQGKVISLAGVTVAPLSTFEPAQVALETKRTKTEWTVTARRNGQWVKVKAFSWEMETDKGKVKLERPVFPYKGELVVPLRQVAEALGISVQQKGQTIALLPK